MQSSSYINTAHLVIYSNQQLECMHNYSLDSHLEIGSFEELFADLKERQLLAELPVRKEHNGVLLTVCNTKALLKDQEAGTFFFRKSSQPDFITLCAKSHSKIVEIRFALFKYEGKHYLKIPPTNSNPFFDTSKLSLLNSKDRDLFLKENIITLENLCLITAFKGFDFIKASNPEALVENITNQTAHMQISDSDFDNHPLTQAVRAHSAYVNCNREEAENRLRGLPAGTFLIRPAQKKHSFAISYVEEIITNFGFSIQTQHLNFDINKQGIFYKEGLFLKLESEDLAKEIEKMPITPKGRMVEQDFDISDLQLIHDKIKKQQIENHLKSPLALSMGFLDMLVRMKIITKPYKNFRHT